MATVTFQTESVPYKDRKIEHLALYEIDITSVLHSLLFGIPNGTQCLALRVPGPLHRGEHAVPAGDDAVAKGKSAPPA